MRLPPSIQTQLVKHRHFLLYVAIGLSGVTIDYVLFALGTEVLGMAALLANFIAISIAIVNNFWLNTVYNFKTHDHLVKRFALFYAVGALGIVLSEVLLFLFHYGFGLDSLIAKLGTLPFVLLFQFFLNKRFSFGDMRQTRAQLRKIFFHWPLYVILTLYGACSILLIATIPADFRVGNPMNGPDEAIHYSFNVRHILEEKSLPVSGVDDLETYGACRDNGRGIVPCVYSYNTYPGPNYIVSAISAGLLSKGGVLSPEVASRLTSLVCGLLFVLFVYLSAFAILRRRGIAAILTVTAAFIPQVLFTNSYTNLDAHALAIAALLCYTAIRFMQQPRRRLTQIAFCIALFGLLPISKYNYAVLGIGGLAVLIYTVAKHRFKRPELLRIALYAAISFIVLASFWYIRNLILYGDLTGQTFMLNKMAEFHDLGIARPMNMESLLYLVHHDFFIILFRSFYFAFGMMNYFLADHLYSILMAALVGAVTFGGYITFQRYTEKQPVRNLLLAGGLCLAIGLGTLLMIVYNSLYYDFQPQGRYMYPVLVPAVLLVAYAIRQDKRFQPLAFLLAAATAFIFIEGLVVFIKVYLPL